MKNLTVVEWEFVRERVENLESRVEQLRVSLSEATQALELKEEELRTLAGEAVEALGRKEEELQNLRLQWQANHSKHQCFSCLINNSEKACAARDESSLHCNFMVARAPQPNEINDEREIGFEVLFELGASFGSEAWIGPFRLQETDEPISLLFAAAADCSNSPASFSLEEILKFRCEGARSAPELFFVRAYLDRSGTIILNLFWISEADWQGLIGSRQVNKEAKGCERNHFLHKELCRLTFERSESRHTGMIIQQKRCLYLCGDKLTRMGIPFSLPVATQDSVQVLIDERARTSSPISDQTSSEEELASACSPQPRPYPLLSPKDDSINDEIEIKGRGCKIDLTS